MKGKRRRLYWIDRKKFSATGPIKVPEIKNDDSDEITFNIFYRDIISDKTFEKNRKKKNIYYSKLTEFL